MEATITMGVKVYPDGLEHMSWYSGYIGHGLALGVLLRALLLLFSGPLWNV